MRVIVLGAGIIGVSSAWYLAERGHRVAVVERQPGPALETSFANGGQLSTGHVEPWAGPATLPLVLSWAWQEHAPLLFRPRLDLAQWRWALAFLRECTPARSQRNLSQLLALGLYSQRAQRELEQTLGIEYAAQHGGIINLYSTPGAWRRGLRSAAAVQSRGYPRHSLSRAQALALEPALADSTGLWLGATFTPEDASGDAQLWTAALAERAGRCGVRFLYGCEAVELLRQHGRVSGVRWRPASSAASSHDQGGSASRMQELPADAVVVCLGSYSAPFLKPLGLRLPVYPVKGYSATFPIAGVDQAPRSSITDDAHKIVITRLGERLRVAGTAEFTGYDTSLNRLRCEALTQRAAELFPRACHYDQPTYWCGLRPATPSNQPLIGPSSVPGLYLNTGHGTLGWTLGSGSAQALAELIDGLRPRLDYPFLTANW